MRISEFTLSVSEVRDCLSNLDPLSKATGPDGVPVRTLRE